MCSCVFMCVRVCVCVCVHAVCVCVCVCVLYLLIQMRGNKSGLALRYVQYIYYKFIKAFFFKLGKLIIQKT